MTKWDRIWFEMKYLKNKTYIEKSFTVFSLDLRLQEVASRSFKIQ